MGIQIPNFWEGVVRPTEKHWKALCGVAKMAAPIQMPLGGGLTQVDRRNHVWDGSRDPPREGGNFGVRPRNISLNCVKSLLTIDWELRRVRTTLYHERTSVWLTVQFLLLDRLYGTSYRTNFAVRLLTARFATVFKTFSFILSYSTICLYCISS